MEEKIIVTICRQFCSGGREIGKRLAEKLNFNFYDKELISLASKESGFTEALFKNADEKVSNSFLYSVVMGTQSLAGAFFQSNDFLTNDKLFSLQSEVIRNISKNESAVIVGRCSDYILRNMKSKVTRVYLKADMDFRIERLMQKKNNIDLKEAENIINKTDKKRANYYSYYTGNDWNNVNNYDIVLNVSKIGIENSVDSIIGYINKTRDKRN